MGRSRTTRGCASTAAAWRRSGAGAGWRDAGSADIVVDAHALAGPGAAPRPGVHRHPRPWRRRRVVRRRSRCDPDRPGAAPRARHHARRRLARDRAARDARAPRGDGGRPRRDGCRHPGIPPRGTRSSTPRTRAPTTRGCSATPLSADLERLLEAGRGTVRQVTLAPELPGGLDAIRLIVGAGAAAAIGHTGADYAACMAAFDAGATILTHAFNAMPGLHHRDPGPVGAAASDPRVVLEVIADGVHLHPRGGAHRVRGRARPDRPRDRCDGRRGCRRRALRPRLAPGRGGRLRRPPGQRRRDRGIDADAGCCAPPRGRGRRSPRRCCRCAHVDPRAGDRAHATSAALAPGFLADAVLLSADLRVHRVWTAGEAAAAG